MLMPWEREVYLSMLLEHIKEQKEEERRRAMTHG